MAAAPRRLARLHLSWYNSGMVIPAKLHPQKTPLIFFRTERGSEPVREWLRDLPIEDRREVGKDLMRAQWRWPVGMPLCRPMGDGLWEIRTDLPSSRIARVLLGVDDGVLVALHGFIKKTQKTPPSELEVARKRLKELKS
jgi:phage-related protein